MRRKSNNDESFDVCGNASEVQPSKHQLKKERRQARKERKRQRGGVAAREQSSNAKEDADTKNSAESGQFLWFVGCCWSVCRTSHQYPSLGVKCLGYGADHLTPFSAKFKYEWSHTSASPLGVCRDNCTLLPLPGSRQLTICLQQDTGHLLSVSNDPLTH
jgi:hypothetical protein